MKTYISEVEGLLMYSPAVFLHKGQKLKAAQDTVEILQALAGGMKQKYPKNQRLWKNQKKDG